MIYSVVCGSKALCRLSRESKGFFRTPFIRRGPQDRFFSSIESDKEPSPKDLKYYTKPEVSSYQRVPFSTEDCAAWDLTCPTWKKLDRGSREPDNWPSEDPDDWNRVSFQKEFTEWDKLDFSVMKPATKDEMFQRYSEDPNRWTVSKLASSYRISQPRVQAILLLKTWETKQREAGFLTQEDEEREAAMYEAHVEYVDEREAYAGVKLRRDRFSEASESSRRGGPLGRFRTVYDDEAAPEKPDPLAYSKKDDENMRIRAEQNQKRAEAATQISKKRWTFVVHDTSDEKQTDMGR